MRFANPLPLLFSLSLLLAAGQSHALSTDSNQPIRVQADSAELDDGKGVATYRGNVVITQGSLRVTGTSLGYPIVDCVARMTPDLAWTHRAWLDALALEAPNLPGYSPFQFQDESSVESFGWQWSWNSQMRSEADLRRGPCPRPRSSPD